MPGYNDPCLPNINTSLSVSCWFHGELHICLLSVWNIFLELSSHEVSQNSFLFVFNLCNQSWTYTNLMHIIVIETSCFYQIFSMILNKIRLYFPWHLSLSNSIPPRADNFSKLNILHIDQLTLFLCMILVLLALLHSSLISSIMIQVEFLAVAFPRSPKLL